MDTTLDQNSSTVQIDQERKQNDDGNLTLTNNCAVNSRTDNNTIREKCAYGGTCYRKNNEHKVKYSHPGDLDYDIVDTRPECPYGIKCYRKNKQHKLTYKHQKIKPSKRTTGTLNYEDFFSSDEESIDESEYNPSESDEAESNDY